MFQVSTVLDGDRATAVLTVEDPEAPGTPVRLKGLSPDQLPPPGRASANGAVRLLSLPGTDRRGRASTAAAVIGLRGRAVLWAPAGPDPEDTAGLPPACLQALAGAGLDAVVLDLAGVDGPARLAADLAALRRAGATGPRCDVVALGADQQGDGVRPSLARRLLHWRVRPVGRSCDLGPDDADRHRLAAPERTLVLGPAASGKSAVAEDLLAAEPEVVYLATGPPPDGGDPDWEDRVRRHRARRPQSWVTQESGELDLLRRPGPALLLDSLGTWVTGALERSGAWQRAECHDGPAESSAEPGWRDAWQREVAALVSAWRGAARRVVAVSEETGWGVVPATGSGRLFRECLGEVNRLLASEGESCLLVVAGRVVELDD